MVLFQENLEDRSVKIGDLIKYYCYLTNRMQLGIILSKDCNDHRWFLVGKPNADSSWIRTDLLERC